MLLVSKKFKKQKFMLLPTSKICLYATSNFLLRDFIIILAIAHVMFEIGSARRDPISFGSL